MRSDGGSVWQILRGSGASSGATAAGLLCHLATITLIARLVDQNVFGAYLLVLAAAQGVKVLGGLGLDITLTRHLASEAPQARPATVAYVTLLRVSGLLAACLLLMIAGRPLSWLHMSLPAQTGYLLAIAVIGSGRELLLAALQGLLEFWRYAYGVLLPAALRLGGVALFYATGRGDLADLLQLEIAVLALSLLAMLRLSPVRRLIGGGMRERGLLRRLLRFSAPLYANSILYFLSGRLNLFLLAGLTNPVQVANYGVAWQVPNGCSRIVQALGAAYFPFAARLSGEADHRGVARLTEFALALAAFGTMLTAVLAGLFGAEFLTLLFGESYRPAAAAFALLMVAFGLQSLISVMGYSLVAAAHPGVTTKINVIGMVLLLGGSLAAIPVLGAAGAAGALVGSSALVLALSWRALSRRGLRVDGMTFLIPLTFGLLAIGLGHGLAGSSIAGRLAFVGLYLLACGAMLKELRASLRFLVGEARLPGAARP